LLEAAGLGAQKQIVLLHPGGHYESQRWPVERFAEVAAGLARPDRWCALLGGPSDEELLRAASGVPVARLSDFRELAGALTHAHLLVCNNSGPLHAACALGVRTVSTLGPTDAAVWGPPPPHQILKGEPVSSIASRDVLERARQLLGGTR
jgi:ADP-heptose:LPS heptosyltransferase